MRHARILTSLVALCVLAAAFAGFLPRPVRAFSPAEHFSYTYSFSLSKTSITGSETFFVTVSGQATCLKDLPVGVGAATVSSRVVARHQQTGAQITLNADFSMSYANFPDKKGQTVSDSIQVPLFFPEGSTAGAYDVVGQLIEARVSVVFPVDVTSFFPSEQGIGSVTYQPRSSGGGMGISTPPAAGAGGGEAAIPIVTASRTLTAFVDATGRVIQDVQHKSSDQKVLMTIRQNTTARAATGGPLLDLTVDVAAGPVRLPDGRKTLSTVYSFGPPGATFDPPITVGFRYDRQTLPVGADEKRAYAAVWNAAAGTWDPLPSVVDVDSSTVNAEVRHFSTMTVLVPTAPAVFVFSDLKMSPSQPLVGESLYVGVRVENGGDLTEEQNIILELDGTEAAQRVVTLAGGDAQQVTFSLPPGKAGPHTIAVGDVAVSFSVRDAPQSAAEALEPSPTFSISGLMVTPASVTSGQMATVSIYIANDGNAPGAYALYLAVDGRILAERSVDLPAGTQQKVAFELYANEAGTHTVEMSGLSRTFSVSAPQPPEPPPAESKPRFPAVPLAATGAGVMVIGIAFLAWRRRPGAKRP